MRPGLPSPLGALGLLLLAPAALAQPQEGWMLHVNRDAATGVLSYVPDRVDVYAGSTVLIGHVFGPDPHSITSVDGLFNATGDASSWPQVAAPDVPGEYPFYCWVHATPATKPGEGMAGVMVVHAREANATPTPSPEGVSVGRSPVGASPATTPGPGVLLLAVGAAGALARARRR